MGEVSKQIMMRSILLLLATAALSFACDDKASIMQTCLADTPEFATRLASAFEACGVVTGAQDRIGLLSDKCPSSMSIMMKFGMRYRDEVCFSKLLDGWMMREKWSRMLLWQML